MPYKDPEKQRAYKREWGRLRRAGISGTPRGTRNPAPEALTFRVQTARDVLELLSQLIYEVRAEKRADILSKARTAGYLASLTLKAIETADLEARIAALEEAWAAKQVERRWTK